ncbi:protein TOPLESS-like [Pyrus x bretschneideri]|uniref:protein TOPLESS-like n=1 Tax=Pyrus x bretschneideri TaxID=225117 RepID=UPI00202DF3DB|nr:protein TOPLESS-like [Pyrus x bretschneideri]XP_048439849.1 protein TOPLESS-like [Pyrus x bretschneideri]
MKYFEDEVHNGNWDEVEKYLSGFTKMEDNSYSMKIFFEIRKQKYLEALDKPDRSQAVDILVKDLNFFAAFDELLEEIAQLSTLENFRGRMNNYPSVEIQSLPGQSCRLNLRN